MVTHSRKWLWMALLLSTIAAEGARGQWKIVAPNMIEPESRGAMNFSDGIIHVSGSSQRQGVSSVIFNSSDTGKTWSSVNFPSSGISDIDFFDRNNGVVSTMGMGIFITHDGGLTWINFFSNLPDQLFLMASFNGSPLIIHALNQLQHQMISTTDGGINWNTYTFLSPASEDLCFDIGKDRTIYSFTSDDYNPGNDGWINSSSDYGVSWSTPGAFIDGDSYTLSSDSCDTKRLYLVNEDVYWPHDKNAQIFVSSDAGNSWIQTFSRPVEYLSGSLASGPSIIFVPTVWDGELRSSDKGVTWDNIPGPGNVVDSRAICALNDNIFFILDDSSGNVWATYNSGGVSVISTSSVLASPASLFETDTIACDSISHPVFFSRTGCPLPYVSGWSLIGASAASFKASNLSNDSILVSFSGKKQGDQHAQLLLYLNNGSSDTVNLGGYVRESPFTYAVSPQQIFAHDSVYPCKGPIETVYLNTSGCKIPDISSASISGNAASDYTLTKSINTFTGFDSIEFSFSPSDTGIRNASYVMTLSDGSNITISLSGYGIPTILLALNTSDQTIDTLGATVAVPITINNLQRPEDVDLVLHYDGTMDYLGSFSPLGVRLDVPGDSSLGRSVLAITGATSGAVLGYAKFNVFNDSNEAAHASFDLVSVLTAVSPCEYSLPEAVTSTITSPSGCGITILSQFVHLGVEPTFSVRPNPANGDVWISSSADLGDVSFTVYDMLGSERSNLVASVSKDNPIEISLPQADGVYNIVASSYSGAKTIRVVRQH